MPRLSVRALRDRLFGPPPGRPLGVRYFTHLGFDQLTREVRQRSRAINLERGDALCKVLGRYKMIVATADRGLAPHLLIDGYWEMWLTRFLAARVAPGMRVMDVGANLGYYTVLLADLVGRGGRVLAIEPNPAMMRLLRRNLLLNGLESRVEVIEAALGAEAEASGTLFVPHEDPKNATIVPQRPDAIGNGSLRSVRVTTLDALAAGPERLDLVKIDAEGAEEAILAGMEATLRRDQPDLVLEFNAARSIDPAALLSRLGDHYPALHVIEPDGRVPRVTREALLRERHGEDRLLFAPHPGRPLRFLPSPRHGHAKA